MSFSKILVICLYTETVEVDQFSELATLVLAPCTRRINIGDLTRTLVHYVIVAMCR